MEKKLTTIDNLREKKAKSLFITGTGTDVGKTYVTGLILKKLDMANCKAAYYKLAMSGNLRDKEGNLIPGDAKKVKELSGIKQDLAEMCSYVYENAYSPHLASRIEGNPVDIRIADKEYKNLLKKYDFVTLEGSGGITCPIRFDHEKIFLDDYVKEKGLPCLIVADAGLGTINYVVLTCHYMEAKGIKVKGIIFNNYVKGDVMHEDNLKMCEYLTGIKVIAKVSRGDKEINIDEELLKSLYE